MSDETTKLDEYQKNIYENNLLEIYKLLLILRNVVKIGKMNGEISPLNNSEKLIEEFVLAANYIRQFPLYFPPESQVAAYVQSWLAQLQDVMYQTNGIFNSHILKSQNDLMSVSATTKLIIDYYNQNSESKDLTLSRSLEYKILVEKFRSYDITYDNILAARELGNDIDEIRNNLHENLKQSDKVKEIFSSIENQYQGFNAFVEKNYNDETKKVYDEIYKNEYGLADKYRKYASIIFLIIALIATLNFLIPTIEGSINFFKNGVFATSPIDVLFFLKTIFMLLLTAPGWYFARESAKHRQVSYKAKIISAELTALPYYLADLEAEKRHEMRMKMTDKFFGQELYNDKKSDNSNVNEQTKATTEAIKTINTLLGKAIKPGEGA